MKKVKIHYGKWDFYFSKGEWENIKSRFDLREKYLVRRGPEFYWYIRVPCSLCEKYHRAGMDRYEDRCKGCTFNKFGWHRERNPCLCVLDEILGEPVQFRISTNRIEMDRGNRKQFAQVRKIHAALIKAEKEWLDK